MTHRSIPTSTMPRCPTKVPSGKTTAVPGGVSKLAPEAIKMPKAMQKTPAPKHTTKHAHSRCHDLKVNILLTIPCNIRLQLLPSMIRAVAKSLNLNSLAKMRRTMPHHRRNNLSLKLWILCSTPLLACVRRTPGILTSLVEL